MILKLFITQTPIDSHAMHAHPGTQIKSFYFKSWLECLTYIFNHSCNDIGLPTLRHGISISDIGLIDISISDIIDFILVPTRWVIGLLIRLYSLFILFIIPDVYQLYHL